MLELCVQMTRTPARVPPELFEGLREHFTPRQIVELVTAVALENFRARFNRPFDVAAEGVSAGAWCPLPETEP